MYVYNIIDVVSGETLATFDTPQAAIAAVSDYHGVKTRIVKAPRVETGATSPDANPADAAKAAAMDHITSKFEDGTYHRPRLLSPSDPWFTPEKLKTYERALGFSLSSIPEDMCIHKSTQDPSKVCYVRWNERGQPTITRVTYPRLLEILGASTSIARDIGCFLREVNEKGEHIISRFELSTRADGIVDVYTNGPQSCMSHAEEHYETGDSGHPVGVYGRPDNNGVPSPLGVYSYNTGQWFSRDEDDDEDDDGDYYYTARTLVDHQAKIFSRIYGQHSEELAGYLRSIGYTRDGEDDRSFDTCGSWFCPDVFGDGSAVYLVMPYVDNYGTGHYDVRDGRVYFGDTPERVSVPTHTTSGAVRAYSLALRECICCGEEYVSLSREYVSLSRESDAAKELVELGWFPSACPACNNSGVAKERAVQEVWQPVRTIVGYSLDDRQVSTSTPLTPAELEMISNGTHVLVFEKGQLRLYAHPNGIPDAWEQVYPSVFWADSANYTLVGPIRAAIIEYLLWFAEFLPTSWFDDGFMWVHRVYADYVFIEHHGTRAKKYTTPSGLFVGYKSRWGSSVRRLNPLTDRLSLFSPSLRHYVRHGFPSSFSSVLKGWQDANTSL